MKKVPSLVCFLLLLLSFSSGRLQTAQVSAQPQQQETIKLEGLRGRVQIRRDGRGIPYIEAENTDDLYFAQGYTVASDRLWQMDFMRRVVRGELSEILGRAALEQDKLHRTYGFARVAEAEVAMASTHERALLEAYARGVNAYIASLDDKSLPPEFQILQYRPRPWTPADSVLIIKLFFEALTDNWETDIFRAALSSLPAEKRDALLPDRSPLDVLVVGTDDVKRKAATSQIHLQGEGQFAILRELIEKKAARDAALESAGLFVPSIEASNNWVVSGKRTASGKPLLANDPHLPPSAPSIWYMMHLSAPSGRVAGVTSPGLPGIVIGHNEQIAWGFTNLGPDVSDLYIEKFDQANPRRYLTPAGWREAEVRHEEIRVRKGFTGSDTETIPLDVTVTRHGPIVFEKNQVRYALRWTALDPSLQDFAGFDSLNRARNWTEFRAALSTYAAPVQNMVYADTAGHIGYYAAGRVPVRKSGDGSTPYDGSTDAGEWTGYIPFDRLPHLLDPPSGLIVTANQRVTGSSYPFFLTNNWAAPYRARRILELLEAKQKLSAEDFQRIQGDTYSIAAAAMARAVLKAASEATGPNVDGDAKWLETVKLLAGWDGRMDASSGAALYAVVMRTAFRRRIFEAALGTELAASYRWSNSDTLIDRILTERPQEWLPKEFRSYAELLRACYVEARQVIGKRLGEDESKWTWGNYRQASFPHPLARAPLIGLQFTVPPVAQNGTAIYPSVNVGNSVSMRLIADPADWDRTQQGIAPGESGDPSSPHWKDQLADWRAVTTPPFPFTPRAVAAAARQTIILTPAK